MSSAARAIELATERLQALMSRPRDSSRFSALDLQVHDSILATAMATMAITNTIARLIKAATDSQQEIVNEGRGSSSSQQFYKRNNRWTEGLISAAKSVAFSTNLLIESADGVLSGTHSLEQPILVAASRRLEWAAKAVREAWRALVRQVKVITAQQVQDELSDYANMAVMEFKRQEMEQQVEILKLEKDLGAARSRLGAIRRAGYHTDETD
ncbi:cytoskeleton assembly control protein SLA2 [Mycena olivaceomarginata]|nr:cytoskeleton assembly control protein SLA2 [Mycena olivaceomarginata]